MQDFAFNLGAHVKLADSDETGTAIARAEFQHSENQYMVRYRAGDGRLMESWWGESALTAA